MNNSRFDDAYLETEELLSGVKSEINKIYSKAEKSTEKTAADYLKFFAAALAVKVRLLKSGKISKNEFRNQCFTLILSSRNYHDMSRIISTNLVSVNQNVMKIINEYMPAVYALNINFITYSIENSLHIDTDFPLYNEIAVSHILRENPDLLPKASVNVLKDKQWNRQKINALAVQGIIQGDNIDSLAKRIAEASGMNKTSVMRNAATMFTSAQNGGRYQGIRRANNIGIECDRKWIATLDSFTRDSHRRIDGEIAKAGKKFSNGLMYPGDPNGKPEEVYNCRCCLVAVFPDSDFSLKNRFSRLDSMSYDDWKNTHIKNKRSRKR